MVTTRTRLGDALRAWRERVTPAAAGLPAGAGRRVPGLRREELAALAGISVDYLVRLEQSRAENPSPQVLGALARALRLSERERDLLYDAAGVAPPRLGTVPDFVPPGIQRMVDRLADTPVGVFTAAWDIVQWNALWAALLGAPPELSGRDRNLIWRYFSATEPEQELSRSVIVHEGDDGLAQFEREMVVDLRAASDRYPHDRRLADLIAELRRISERFAELWGRFELVPRGTTHKTVHHPAVGPVPLDCDVLVTDGGDLRLVVYTAEPGSAAASSLDLLRVAGALDL